MSYKNIDAVSLLNKRNLHLIDVRTADERSSEFGFIPGSLFSPDGAHLAELLELLPENEPVALCCMSGRRSKELCEKYSTLTDRVFYNVEGGLLSWQAHKFPIATYQPDTPDEFAFDGEAEDFFIKMRSCFVGEVVEVIVERDLDLNPLELLQTSTQLAQLYHNGAPFEERLVDFAGYVSWHIGTDIEHIATNMTWALANRNYLKSPEHQAKLSW